MCSKRICKIFSRVGHALLAIVVVSVSPAQAATISMTANNNYFAGWVWNSFPVPPNTAYCPNSGSVPTNTVMQGLLNGQSFTVTDVGQAPITNWQLCGRWGLGSYIPAGTGLPSTADQVNLTTGDLLLQSATPLPAGTFIAFEDMDYSESAHLTFRDCSGNAIDPVNFDTLILSSNYVAGPVASANQPMATSTYVPASGGNPPQWVFQPPGRGGVPNTTLGLLMHSASICSIEIGSPVNGTSGGYTFFLGAPPVTSLAVTKTVTGGPAGYSDSFPISVACTLSGKAVSGITPSATQSVTAGTGTSGTVSFGNIPLGSTCTVSEGTLPTAPSSYAWGTPVITQPTGPVAASGSAAAVTNILTGSPIRTEVAPVPMLDWKWLWSCVALLVGTGVASSRRRRLH